MLDLPERCLYPATSTKPGGRRVDSVLESLTTYLANDLDGVAALLGSVYRVEGKLMQEVADYVRHSRGKMLRPTVVCLAARLAGDATASAENRYRVGAAAELIHTATLLQDDVIDKAPLRRGRSTVNAQWGDDVAILMGDYLYATAYDLLLSTLRPEAIRIFAKVTQDMTFGEMLQIETRAGWLTVDDYLKIIRNKTACLFSACTGLGALVGNGSTDCVKKMADFGMDFGMAFQLIDDALDYSAQGEKWGKRVGSDVAEGKQTLPLLHTLKTASPEDRASLLACLNNGREFTVVNRFVGKYQGVEITRDLARDYIDKALGHLDGFEDSEPLAFLRQIARNVVTRDY